MFCEEVLDIVIPREPEDISFKTFYNTSKEERERGREKEKEREKEERALVVHMGWRDINAISKTACSHCDCKLRRWSKRRKHLTMWNCWIAADKQQQEQHQRKTIYDALYLSPLHIGTQAFSLTHTHPIPTPRNIRVDYCTSNYPASGLLHSETRWKERKLNKTLQKNMQPRTHVY